MNNKSEVLVKRRVPNTILSVLGFVLSIGSIVFILTQVDLSVVWQDLQRLSLTTIVTLILLYLAGILLRAFRWRTLLIQRSAVPIAWVFKSLIYGFMLNQLLPAKMGELARAEYLTRKDNSSRSFILGTIAVERLFDLFTVMILFVSSVIFSPMLQNLLRSSWISLAIFLLVVGILLWSIYNMKVLKKVLKFIPDRVRAKLEKIIDNLEKSFSVFRAPNTSLLVIIYTFIIWLVTCVMFVLITSDLAINLPWYGFLFLVSAGTFGMIIPSTSAGVGVYHAIAMGALMLFMVPREQALSFAIIAHAFDFFPAIILGSLILGYGGVKRLFQAYFFKRSDS